MKPLFLAALLSSIAGAVRAESLTDDQKKMLCDAAGWEYLSLADSQNGFPTVHTCFDGKPHKDECSGKLTLTSSLTFTQITRIEGQNVQRSGRYELNDDQLAFFDEFGTKDGPYTLTLDLQAKTLKLAMPQVTIELLLEKEYRERNRAGGRK